MTTAAPSTPRHVRAFRDALLEVAPIPITVPGTDPPLAGKPGIRESTRIHYNNRKFQQLGRKHEYTFALASGDLLKLSVQLYENDRGHWRLFAYSVVNGNKTPGMLLSINLTLGHDGSNVLSLKQRLKLATRGLTTQYRNQTVDLLAARLRGCGLNVTSDREIIFSDFDAGKRRFVNVTAAAFLHDFVVAAVLKGHYMANKGYALPGLDAVVQPDLCLGRRAAVSLEVEENAAEEEGAFHPQNPVDAREKILAAIVRRRGQAAFRKALIEAYGGKCAVTGCDFEEALEAAHITPYRGDHTNYVTNGLLLRADIHTLFDLGYLAVDPEMMVVLASHALSGTVYQDLAGQKIALPKESRLWPDRAALDQHRKAAGL